MRRGRWRRRACTCARVAGCRVRAALSAPAAARASGAARVGTDAVAIERFVDRSIDGRAEQQELHYSTRQVCLVKLVLTASGFSWAGDRSISSDFRSGFSAYRQRRSSMTAATRRIKGQSNQIIEQKRLGEGTFGKRNSDCLEVRVVAVRVFSRVGLFYCSKFNAVPHAEIKLRAFHTQQMAHFDGGVLRDGSSVATRTGLLVLRPAFDVVCE